MAIASITEWLNKADKSYTHGKSLYLQYGNKEFLKALFTSGDSAYHFKKLETALTELNKLNNPAPKQIIYAEKPKKINTPKVLMDFEGAPDQIIIIRNDKNKAYALARNYFETIPYMDSKVHRKEAGKELLELMAHVQKCWAAIDEWKENGHIRKLKLNDMQNDINSLSIVDLMKEENNLPPNICKDKKKLKAETDPKRKLVLDARIKERSKRLELVKKKINEFIQNT